MEPYWDLVKRIINESDLVLEILDARMIELSRNEEVERLIKDINRPLIFVVNKSDLVHKKALKNKIKKLRKEGEVVYLSAKEKKNFIILLYYIQKVFKKFGKREQSAEKLKFREAKADIVVGVLGYPNVGKSSIINLLAHKKKAKVSRSAGTTHGIHWIKATDEIKLIDSPGVIPLKKDDEIRYALIGAKNAENLNDPEVVADGLIKLFFKSNPQSFEHVYGIKIVNNSEKVLEEICRKKGYMLKGGKFDINRAGVTIIRDWQNGKLIL